MFSRLETSLVFKIRSMKDHVIQRNLGVKSQSTAHPLNRSTSLKQYLLLSKSGLYPSYLCTTISNPKVQKKNLYNFFYGFFSSHTWQMTINRTPTARSLSTRTYPSTLLGHPGTWCRKRFAFRGSMGSAPRPEKSHGGIVGPPGGTNLPRMDTCFSYWKKGCSCQVYYVYLIKAMCSVSVIYQKTDTNFSSCTWTWKQKSSSSGISIYVGLSIHRCNVISSWNDLLTLYVDRKSVV